MDIISFAHSEISTGPPLRGLSVWLAPKRVLAALQHPPPSATNNS